jgi:hypothetical protein
VLHGLEIADAEAHGADRGGRVDPALSGRHGRAR